MQKIIAYQDKVLKILKGKTKGFYLAGGTALSKFYFHHRESEDLDFFAQSYSAKQIDEMITLLEQSTKKKILLQVEQSKNRSAKIRIYYLMIEKKEWLKIDFVEDFTPLIHPTTEINGIPVLSKDDIYFRKIGAAAGTIPSENAVGQKQFLGGRQEAKDFFDLYILSTVYSSLSLFAEKHCDILRKQGLVQWFFSFDRMRTKLDLMDLETSSEVDFSVMERHFKKEIEKIIGQAV